MLKKFKILILFCSIAISTGCQANLSKQQETAKPLTPNSNTKSIIIADVSNNPAKKLKRYQPMADYLAAQLREFGIGRGEVKIASDLDQIVQWLKNDKIDIYFDSLYPAMMVTNRVGGKIILRRWKRGGGDYNTIIFAMKSSGLKNLEQLKGKMMALDEPNSTSGFMLPVTHLLKNGLNPVKKGTANSEVKQNEVGYIFSKDDENTIQWVISAKVAAGAADNQTFAQIPEQTRRNMNIIAETEKVPRQVVIVSPHLRENQVAAIKNLLINMDKTEEGKKILKQFEETAKFDDLSTATDFDKMRQLYELVKNR
jgi:phosphonate transport system substrate-binding protein